ncbi:uncharacterized protein FPRO_09807 [Fusarium proliferatum ET1]|uniref:Uncharacterized protein n=1 Tax=Fusarium proliferatum (strain ET1) TaxID=1227346 RepID=A0A1L7VQ01_FUSPR|nr:uncharacterized protein FPRO_09807 [Fusarium proliferatum ET1]CZR42504.1 uncharacterized protein FPRO_09807 [Fusarium proliferatum ET1]
MLKDHQQQLGKIDQKYRGEGRHPDHQGDGVMGADSFGLNISSPNDRDSDLEADDEWEDVVPKSEKMEEHFAYVQAATSLQRPFDVPSGCDKRTMCILRMRKLARYFFAYRYTKDLPLEGSNLFTSTSLNALGTNKKRNFNSPKHWKIRGLEILYPKPTSRNATLFLGKWSLEHGIRLRPDSRRHSR